ncbi:MAG TPA: hypothetical protein VH331_12025 [Allosphingosinicella sp.]|jgi:hypothetical protein|nr:hypothetical protein [Allosphingosinicella sp.]
MTASSLLRTVIAFGFTSFAAAAPAMAGSVSPTPAPLIGAGIPALIAFAGGYAAIRRRRRN